MNQTAETFDQNALVALQDSQLRGALDNLAKTFDELFPAILPNYQPIESQFFDARQKFWQDCLMHHEVANLAKPDVHFGQNFPSRAKEIPFVVSYALAWSAVA